MKKFSFILSVYFLCLNLLAYSNVTLISKQNKVQSEQKAIKSCCKSKTNEDPCAKNKKGNKHSDCRGNGCNPFMVCCNYCATAVSTVKLNSVLNPLSEIIPSYNNNYSLLTIADLLRPPAGSIFS